MVYDLNSYVSLYASYANVFQPVTVQNEQGTVLDPEEGVTYELGSKAEFFNGRLNVALAHFWKRWENTHEPSGGLTPTGGQAYRNVDGTMERGYELELSGELMPRWQIQGGYVMNNSSLRSGVASPKHQFKINTSYRLAGQLSNLTLGSGARWQSTSGNGEYAYYHELEQKAYWLVAIMARYRITQNLTSGININNVFDKKYFSGAYTIGGRR